MLRTLKCGGTLLLWVVLSSLAWACPAAAAGVVGGDDAPAADTANKSAARADPAVQSDPDFSDSGPSLWPSTAAAKPTPAAASSTPQAATAGAATGSQAQEAPSTPAATGQGSAAEPASGAQTQNAQAPPAATAGSPQSIWIWQGSDDAPVNVKKHRLPGVGFNPLGNFGYMQLGGRAYVGYITQSQSFGSRYNDLDAGVELAAGGFIYHPNLLTYALSGNFDHTGYDTGAVNGGNNGLSFMGSVSLLQATMLPVAIAFTESANSWADNLSSPVDLATSSLQIVGRIQRLPVNVSYSFGNSNSKTIGGSTDGFNTKSRTANFTINKDWRQFYTYLSDNYQDTTSSLPHRADNGQSSLGQRINQVNFGARREFMERRASMFFNGIDSKFKLNTNSGNSSDNDVVSLTGGLTWKLTSKLDIGVNAGYTRNAVNILQVISEALGTSVLNAQPSATVVATHSQNYNSYATYRPDTHWTFGLSGAYTFSVFPASSVAGSSSGTGSATASNNQRSYNGNASSVGGSTAYNRKLWRWNYNVGGSVSRQTLRSLQSGNGTTQDTIQIGHPLNYTFTTAIGGGDERYMRYALFAEYAHTDNPVFLQLLRSIDRRVGLDFATNRFRLFHLSAKVDYNNQGLQYVGSTQGGDGFNAAIMASRPKLDVTFSHTKSNTNQLLFGASSPIWQSGVLAGTSPSLALLVPWLYSINDSDTFTVNWRPRSNLQINGLYARFNFTLAGQQNTENASTIMDFNARYKFGRFDLFGGVQRSTAGVRDRDTFTHRIYFRVQFPFQLW